MIIIVNYHSPLFFSPSRLLFSQIFFQVYISSGKTSMQNFAKFMQVFHLSLILQNDARLMKNFEKFCIIEIIEINGW